MTTVIICGEKNDGDISGLVFDRLCESFCVVAFGNFRVFCKGEGYEIAVFETERLDFADIDGVIVILKSGFVPQNIRLNNSAVVIASAESSDQLAALSSLGAAVITCGKGRKNTVSFTSRSDDGAVVAINRSLVSLSGRIIEPLEIPVSFDGDYGLYDIMALTVLELLLDDKKSKNAKLYG